MSRAMTEYIQAAKEICDEIWGKRPSSEGIRKILSRDFKDWKLKDRHDLLVLVIYMAQSRADFLYELTSEEELKARGTAKALARFLDRDIKRIDKATRDQTINKFLRPLLQG